MRESKGRRCRHGCTLLEVLVGLAAVGGLLVVLAVYGAEVRRNVGLAGSRWGAGEHGRDFGPEHLPF